MVLNPSTFSNLYDSPARLYNLPTSLDETGKLQHALKTKDVVLCLCYQPPGLKYNHPNVGIGTFSQAVYVVGGDYTSEPAFKASGIDRDAKPEDILHIKAGEFVDLEYLQNITLYDTAGPNGVMMIHVNPMAGRPDFNFEFIGPNETRKITAGNKRKFVFCFKEEVFVNNVELSLLNRMRLKPNSEVTIETGPDGACLIMEKRHDKI
jgi:hypothetical protein